VTVDLAVGLAVAMAGLGVTDGSGTPVASTAAVGNGAGVPVGPRVTIGRDASVPGTLEVATGVVVAEPTVAREVGDGAEIEFCLGAREQLATANNKMHSKA
jgi:hypothetical protein